MKQENMMNDNMKELNEMQDILANAVRNVRPNTDGYVTNEDLRVVLGLSKGQATGLKREGMVNLLKSRIDDAEAAVPVVKADTLDASELFRMFLSFNPAKSWWTDDAGVTHYNRVFFWADHYQEWLTLDSAFDKWATKVGRNLGVSLEDLKKDLIGNEGLLYVCVRTSSGKVMLSYNRERLGQYRKKAEKLAGSGTFAEIFECFKNVISKFCEDHKDEIDAFKAAHPEKKSGGVAHAPVKKTENASAKENTDEDCPV